MEALEIHQHVNNMQCIYGGERTAAYTKVTTVGLH